MGIMGILWILLGLVLLLLGYFIVTGLLEVHYFRSRGIYYLGNGLKSFFINVAWKKMTIIELVEMQYSKMKEANVKIGANRDMGILTFMVSDLELLKHIFVKDFDHFVNRRGIGMPDGDHLVKKMLIFLNDDQWKHMRSKMSPTFTTGKIKRMFQLFDQSGKKLVKYVDERMKASESGEIDLWEGYSKFTMDIIASAVCGLDSEAFDQTESSIFEQMGKKMQLQFSPKQFLKFLLLVRFPKLAGWFGMTLFDKDVGNFFSRAIKASIKHRQETGEKRNDFIQLMLEAREGKLKMDESELDTFEKDAMLKNSNSNGTIKQTTEADLLDDDGIVSNCVLFILAGFDTTQSLLLFCAYALALHQDIQDKLRSEINSVLEENDGEFTYESLSKLTYLDMVINETLRFYPPAIATDRGCFKEYKFPGTEIVIQKGNGVMVPVIGIHHDEQYYPEPEKFDPERFSPENKSKINPYAFLPFGQGPRNCIGMRFALTEVKVAIAELVHNFTIEPSKKTLIPMVYQNAGSLKPKNGMWLALHRRSDSNSNV